MFELFFQEPDVAVRYAVLFLAAVFAVAGGAGYRRLAIRGLACSLVAFGCGVMLFATATFLGLGLTGRGEGAAVGAILVGITIGGASAVLCLVLVLWRFVGRSPDAFIREGVSLPFTALAILSIGLAVVTYYARTPALQSDRKLAQKTQRSSAVESQYVELSRRGRHAVPEIIQQLQRASDAEIQEFESGLNGGTKKSLILLGQAGGPEAVAELRKWLEHPVAAADIRGIAALSLAEAGDMQSAPAIASLLADNTYEWHKQHPLLYRSLARLKAVEQVESISAALLLEVNEMYQMDGLAALMEIGGSEGWGAIESIQGQGSPELRASARKVLELSPPSAERDRLLSQNVKK